jgi:hypothetical protein
MTSPMSTAGPGAASDKQLLDQTDECPAQGTSTSTVSLLTDLEVHEMCRSAAMPRATNESYGTTLMTSPVFGAAMTRPSPRYMPT